MNASHDSLSTKRQRRKLQFSLRACLIATAVLALGFAYIGRIVYRARHQRSVVAKIEALGGSVAYDDESLRGYPAVKPSATARLLHPYFGHDAFSEVRFVFVGYQFPDWRRPRSAQRPTTDVAEILPATNADLAILSQLPGLLDVVVDKPPTDDEGLRHLARIRKLHGLDLKHPIATGDGLAELRTVPLEWLSLQGPSVNDETIRRISELSGLRHLRFCDTTVTSAGLAHLIGLEKLHTVEFYGNSNVDDDGLRHLAQLPNLESLCCVGVRVTDKGLVHLRGMPRLAELGISYASISDDGLKHLIHLPRLRKLNAAHTPITDAGLATLSQLADLEELYLFNTEISDQGAVHIAKLKQLRILRTEDSNVTEAGLFLLRDHQHLETLSVGPDVTTEAIKELQAMLPHCEVEYRGTIGRSQPDQR